MSRREIDRIAWLTASVGLGLLFTIRLAVADPNSAFFSENMLEQQDMLERASQPGGAWNNSDVNVPSYAQMGTKALGTPVPGLMRSSPAKVS
jgi:hypothetical protein